MCVLSTLCGNVDKQSIYEWYKRLFHNTTGVVHTGASIEGKAEMINKYLICIRVE